MKYVTPSVSETAFNCPHCGAFARQYWFNSHADPVYKDGRPYILRPENIEEINLEEQENKTKAIARLAYQRKLSRGTPFLMHETRQARYNAENVFFSQCFNCKKIAIWIYDRMIFPVPGEAPAPNPDLSDDIRRDYNEASSILSLSPRGAAALLRLCIQKLCRELGKDGKNINKDIAALVEDGLHIHVQQALDIVRVVGNDAVHPGQIDLNDNRETAEKLFGLVNLIAEIMISQPKHVRELYESLPEEKRKQIEYRDKKPRKA